MMTGDRPIEIASAVLLSLATVASAWSAYQAARWNGVQLFRLAAANRARHESATNQLLGIQARAFDGSMLVSYLNALSRGDDKLAELLDRTFRPEAKNAIHAWMKTDPFNNLDAPTNPFKLAEYKQAQLEEAAKKADLAEHLQAAAKAANGTGDRYVLLTVLFASVLFFAGMAGTFKSATLHLTAAFLSVVVFAGTLVALVRLPVCKE